MGYADDLVLNEDPETIKINTKTLMKTVKELGLKINSNKTICVIFCRNSSDVSDIDIVGNMFEHVDEFRYRCYDWVVLYNSGLVILSCINKIYHLILMKKCDLPKIQQNN